MIHVETSYVYITCMWLYVCIHDTFVDFTVILATIALEAMYLCRL